MLNLTDLKPGVTMELDGEPYLILTSQHTKMGRGGAIIRTKIKNLGTGAIIDKTFKGAETFPSADLQKKKAQYLYSNENRFYFMDTQNFEQFALPEKQIAENKNYLNEGTEVEIVYWHDKPISLSLPIKMAFRVTYAEPGFRGNTASSTTKPATIETGFQTQVPLFIKTGDMIRIDTRTGEYIERA